ncbi:MAG TPA: hypothetical protein P5290_06750 [Candidatus Methanomethylicus sp.]|nr:hypothetical protein [Candidatus Methanomethylicus sp.]
MSRHPRTISNDKRGFAFTLAAFALVLIVVSAYVALSDASIGGRSIVVKEGMSDLSVLRAILIGGCSSNNGTSLDRASELYISGALQNASFIKHMDLNFDQIVGNGSGEALQRASGVLNVLVKDPYTGKGDVIIIKDAPEGSRAAVADAHLRLIASACASSSTIRLDLNRSLNDGFVVMYTSDSLPLSWSGQLSLGDTFEADYVLHTMTSTGTAPLPGFVGVMIRGLLPLSFLQLSAASGSASTCLATYLSDVVVMSLPDGTITLNATILSLSPVAYYRGSLSGGDILHFL